MRYEVTHFERAAIRSFLPNKPRHSAARPERHLVGLALSRQRTSATDAGRLDHQTEPFRFRRHKLRQFPL
jgi:hypothetical protein